ncbi:MAG: hypothetical protein AABZ53_02720 [Planctomycetota bacterium]
MQHPGITFSELLAGAAGELEPTSLAALESKLSTLPEDLALYRRLCHTIQTMNTDDSVSAPPHALSLAKSLFAGPAQSPFALWLNSAKNVLARLRLDTGGQVTVAGLRGVAEGRHMILEAQNVEAQSVELDLQLSPPAPGTSLWKLRAHLEGGAQPCQSAALTAHASTHILDCQLADADGDVEFDVPPGRYDLIFKVGDTAVRVSDLAVGPQAPSHSFDQD